MRKFSRRSLMAAAAAVPMQAQSAPPAVRLPRKVRVGLIGLEGHTAEILRPLPQLPDVEVVAVCAATAQAAAGLIKRNPRLANAKPYSDYRQLLDREKLDIAAVCNTNGDRAEVILAALARKLHIVAEKPLALNREDLDRIRKDVAKHNVGLSMLLPMRYTGAYLAMRAVVEQGEIGEVAQIAAQKSYKLGDRPEWMKNRRSYGGTIPWIGIHMVDLMRWTSGREFTHTSSFQARVGFPESRDMENTTATIFRLDNGGSGALHMDYFRPQTAPGHGDDRLRLAGVKGIVEYQHSTGVVLMTDKKKPHALTLPDEQSLFVDFLRSVYNGARPTLTLEDIYRVNEIVIASQSAGEQGAVLRT